MWNKEYVAQEKADNQKTHSCSLNNRKSLDKNGEMHIMTVRMFYKKGCESGGQILTNVQRNENAILQGELSDNP